MGGASSIVQALGSLFAGLAFFFVGLSLLTQHLKMLGGRRLRERIAALTRRPFMGLLWGGVFIAVTQSSAATVFLLVGMMRAGMITVSQSLPMIVGVNMAAGLVILILVLDIKLAILFLLGISGLLFTSDRAKGLRSAAGTVFGISLLFFGLDTMQGGMEPLSQTAWFGDAIEWTRGTHLLTFLVGAVLSFIIQSTLAVIVIALALQQSGVIGLPETVMIVYGCNVGSSVLAWALSSGLSGQSKQIAMFQTGYNIVGACILVPLFFLETEADIPLVMAFIEFIVSNDGGQVAAATLISDFVPGVLLFIFRKPVGRLLARIWPETLVEQMAKPKYLHARMTDDPDTALTLIGLEQRRLVESLDNGFDTLRKSGKDANIDAFQEAFNELSQHVREAITDLSTNAKLSEQSFARLNRIMNIQHSLRSTSETLGDLHRAFVVLQRSETGARFVSSAIEGLETILLTLIDVARERSPEDAAFLETMTSEEGNGLAAVRTAYLAEESKLDAGARIELLAAANLCERMIWMFGNMGRNYMALDN